MGATPEPIHAPGGSAIRRNTRVQRDVPGLAMRTISACTEASGFGAVRHPLQGPAVAVGIAELGEGFVGVLADAGHP